MKSAFQQLVRLTGKAVGEYGMIRSGDRILLGISGGKDSLTLLHVLLHLQKKSPVPFTLISATFDPGFPAFGADRTGEYCRSLGVEHRTFSLNMERLLTEKGAGEKPCVLCSRLRRGNLYRIAGEENCGKIALAQHLDDVLASFLIHLVRGGGLTTMGPNVPSDHRKIRIIRPLVFAAESLVAEAAAELSLPVKGHCLYEGQLREKGDRAWAKTLLSEMEKRIPDLRKNMLHSLSDVRPPWLLDKKFLSGGGRGKTVCPVSEK